MSTTGTCLRERVARAALRAGERLGRSERRELRHRLMFEGCKWDPQVGDVDTLAPFPLFLGAATWRDLASLAEKLADETAALESAVLARPRLAGRLGLAGAVRRTLFADGPPTPVAARVMRFDFHPTPDGWRLSEVNSDVPGGYSESSLLSRLMAAHFPSCRTTGDPAAALVSSIARKIGPGDSVVLLVAPGYMEDIQIVTYLATLLRERGLSASVANPSQLAWKSGVPHFAHESENARVHAIVRFYQGEWLARLPRRCGWRNLFAGGDVLVTNPGCSLISESKRLPLLWDDLSVRIPTWREFLPETRDPRDTPWRNDESWIVKSAYSNTGDTVGHRELRPAKEWREMRRSIWLRPGTWIAQQRFVSTPVDTPDGPRHACIGVYTVDGRAAGAYARISPRALIDFESVDAALLIADEY